MALESDHLVHELPDHWYVYCTLSLVGLRLLYFHRLLGNLHHNADQIAHSAVVVTPHGTDLVLDSHVSHNETRVRVLHYSGCSSTLKEQTESGVEVATLPHHSQQVVVLIIVLKGVQEKISQKKEWSLQENEEEVKKKGASKKGRIETCEEGFEKHVCFFFVFGNSARVSGRNVCQKQQTEGFVSQTVGRMFFTTQNFSRKSLPSFFVGRVTQGFWKVLLFFLWKGERRGGEGKRGRGLK